VELLLFLLLLEFKEWLRLECLLIVVQFLLDVLLGVILGGSSDSADGYVDADIYVSISKKSE
jgi:hypothetical protein